MCKFVSIAAFVELPRPLDDKMVDAKHMLLYLNICAHILVKASTLLNAIHLRFPRNACQIYFLCPVLTEIVCKKHVCDR
jgi:hypothetical protein